MQTILDALASIGKAIAFGYQFLVKLATDAYNLTVMVAEFVAQIPSYFGFIPASAVAFVVTIFSVVALYKILGRE